MWHLYHEMITTVILVNIILQGVAMPSSRGIFLTQVSNPCLPYCRQILYHLNHQGSSLFNVHHLKMFFSKCLFVFFFGVMRVLVFTLWTYFFSTVVNSNINCSHHLLTTPFASFFKAENLYLSATFLLFLSHAFSASVNQMWFLFLWVHFEYLGSFFF